MDKKYRIKKILNNNVVSALDGLQEVIIVGMGVGFNTKVNQLIPSNKVEKVFELRREDYFKTIQLAKEVSDDTFYKIITILKKCSNSIGLTLDEHAYMILVDHLNFAMNRHREGQVIQNLLVNDLKILYADAFNLSMLILDQINQSFNVNLPIDEAGFITMHIVNGTQDINNQSNVLTDLVFNCLNVIRDTYLAPLKMDDLVTQRIMIHVKMLIQRVMSDKQVDFKDKLLYNVLEEFESAFKCAQKIQGVIETRLNKTIKLQELVYLTIHLNRLEMLITDK